MYTYCTFILIYFVSSIIYNVLNLVNLQLFEENKEINPKKTRGGSRNFKIIAPNITYIWSKKNRRAERGAKCFRLILFSVLDIEQLTTFEKYATFQIFNLILLVNMIETSNRA